MPPRASSVTFRPTELSQLVAAARRSEGVKQGELERRLGLAPQYVSKIERGAIRRPSDEVLQKLATFLRQDVSDLVDACERVGVRSAINVSAKGRRFQIVTGHTLWAVPALLALRHRDFAAFEFASFGPPDGAPRWLPAGVDDPLRAGALPAFGPLERTYSARDVSTQLRLGRGDFGLLPRAFVTEGGDLEPVVDLMDSSSACVVSLPATLCTEVAEGSISTSMVVELLATRKTRAARSKHTPRITILAEAETVAEDHAFVIQKALLAAGFAVNMPPDVRCSEFDVLGKTHDLEDEHTLIIGWDPPMTWLHRSPRSGNNRRLFPLRADDPASRVRFALVTSKSTKIDPPIALLWRFVEEIDKAGNVVRNIVRGDPSADRNAARFLVRYFSLGDDRAAPADLSLLLRRTLGYLEFCAQPSVRFFGPYIRRALE
jgi:transcriptional regulator with XRE-family HTH domain